MIIQVKNKVKEILGMVPVGKLKAYLGKYISSQDEITIIDIGSHKGDFIDELQKHFRINRAILIEPIPKMSDLLKAKFGAQKFSVFQNALSDVDKQMVEFNVNEFQETSSLLSFKSDMHELGNLNTRLSELQQVETRTLDSIVLASNFGDIDLIKVDVQGAEGLVLKGGLKTLALTRYLWIELSFKPLYVNSSIFTDIYNFLENRGFLLLEISPGHRAANNELLQVDVLFCNSSLV